MTFMNKRIKIFAAGSLMAFSMLSATAQTTANPVKISGVVTDADGVPVIGAVVNSSKFGNQAITDADGYYELTVNDGSDGIVCQYVGHNAKNISLKAAQSNGNISMGEPSGSLDEIINLGYTKVTRRELTGAVSVVSGNVLAKSPESNLGKTFAGRLPGMTVMENDGEPGRGATSSSANGLSLIIRGLTTANGHKPLIIIDGQVCPNVNYTYITPEEIENVTVLKDASALAIYGIEGGNGAVVITTKHGQLGDTRVSVYVDESLQQATKTPMSISAGDYARLRNQAAYNDGLGNYALFSQKQIDGYDDPTNDLYQGSDLYGDLFNKTQWMTRAGLTLSGGTERVKYFANVNYMYESSPFKTEENKYWKYNPSPNTNRFNFRSNVDVKINNWLSAFMGISGSVNAVKTAGDSNANIYAALFKLPPTLGNYLTPLYDADGNKITDGGQVVTIDGVSNPVYGMLNKSGFIEFLRTNINAQGGLTADLSGLTKGLSLSGIVAYQTNSNNKQTTSQDFQTWVRNNNEDAVEYVRLGTSENDPLSYSKTRQMYYNINLMARIDYKRTFGNNYVSALAYFMHQNSEIENNSGAEILPYKRESVGLTATYGFMNRYFINGAVAYSGSEQFHPDHRFYWTPSVSASWIASDEAFLRGAKPYVSLIKPRVSYGINDNDQLGVARGSYWDNVDYQGNQGMRGNPMLAPEKIKKFDVGIDLGFFNNELSVSFDWFKQRCDNVLISSSTLVPSYQGVPLEYYPMVNEGKIKNQGFEVAALYTKPINRDWTVFVGGSFSYNHNEMEDMKEIYREGYYVPYAKKGQSIGQKWGYMIDYSNGNGMFNFADEITGCGLDYSALGTPRLGDFKYMDLNGDGVIDAKDKAPIGYSNVPRGNYTINAGFTYKNFEVSMLFQGTTQRSVVLSGAGSYETPNQGIFSDIHLNAWTEERWLNGETIEYPALSVSKSTSLTDNSYFIQDGTYFKLRNAEIAYSLPTNICRKIKASKIRFSLTGQNLFTISHLRSKHIDPEIGDLASFPTYRVINLGVKVTF